MRIEFGSAQRGHELFATLHRSAGTLGHGTTMEPHRLQPLNPVLSATNRWLAFAPIASAHDPALMQSKDLSAPAATSADELQEDAARAHANVVDVNLRRD